MPSRSQTPKDRSLRQPAVVMVTAESTERVAQTYAFFAFVCGSSGVHGISCLDVNIMVDVPMLRTAEEAKLRLPLRYPLRYGH